MADQVIPLPEPVVAQPPAPTIPVPVQDAPETDFSALLEAADADTSVTELTPPAAFVPDIGAVPPVVEPVVAPSIPPAIPPVVTPPSPPPLVETKPVELPTAPPVVPLQPLAAPEVPPAERPLTEEELKTKRSELVTAFSASYVLSEEDEALLASEPNKVLPRLAGNVAADVFEATTRIIMGQLPALIAQHLQGHAAATQARDAFFQEFPALNKPEYLPTIREVTALYRQLNPKAPYPAAMKAIGNHVSIVLGLAPGAGVSPVAAPSTPPPRPTMPLQPGASASRPPAPAANEWDALARLEPIDE